MTTFISLRRAGAALVATTLAASLVAAGGQANAVPATSPAGQSATWLAKQVNAAGLIHSRTFGGYDDYGLTIDTGLALQAIGGHRDEVRAIRAGLAAHVADYTTDAPAYGDVFAAQIAKLAAFAEQTGGGALNFGGHNLISELDQRIINTGPSAGRIATLVDNTNPYGGDYTNVIGQAFAARALLGVNDVHAPSVTSFLLQQQCSDGYFRESLTADPNAMDQACGQSDAPSVDTTALLVVELAPFAQDDPDLKAALDKATSWLRRSASDAGAYGTTGATQPNTNSSGLAGWALLTQGKCAAAVRTAGWVRKFELSGNLAKTPVRGQTGAIAKDRTHLRSALKDGIALSDQDSWRRATTQAAPALLALSHCG